MSEPVYHPGAGWCDVCPTPEGYAHVYVDGFALCCDINGIRQWRVVGPEPLLFVRCSHVDGAIVAVGQGNATGRALITIGGSAFRSAGMTWGVNPVALANARLYVVRTSIEYDVMTLSGEVVDTRLMTESSQGIRDVVGDDVRFADDWFSRTFDGLRLIQPCQRGNVTVGQADPAQIAAFGPEGKSSIFLGEGFEPHLAALPDGRYVFCARTPRGAAIRVCPPFPAFAGGPTQPPVDPDPEPEPVPDHPDRLADIQRIRATYPTPLGAKHLAFLIEAARTVGAGLLRKDGGAHLPLGDGRGVSLDILCYKDGYGVDILGDAEGAAVAVWNHPPEWDLSPQLYVPLSSIPDQPDPEPEPEPEPQPDPALVARVAKLESDARVWQEQVARLTARVIFLEGAPAVDLKPLEERVAVLRNDMARLRARGRSGNSFGHQHAIDVEVKPA